MIEITVPARDPEIKLVPMIKLIGNVIVSFIKKLTLSLFELVWIPIIKIKNKLTLNTKLVVIFLNKNCI